jgi:hypothetical protein
MTPREHLPIPPLPRGARRDADAPADATRLGWRRHAAGVDGFADPAVERFARRGEHLGPAVERFGPRGEHLCPAVHATPAMTRELRGAEERLAGERSRLRLEAVWSGPADRRRPRAVA